MAEHKKQHYVPQFYLRNFSQDDVHLLCFNLKRNKSFYVKVKNVCQGKYFYSQNTENEEVFSRLESKFALSIKKILDNEDITSLSSDEAMLLLTFISFQQERTKESKISIENHFDWFVSQYIKPVLKSQDSMKQFSEKVIDDIKISWPGGFHYSQAISLLSGEGFMDLRPLLLFNISKHKFITSDAPIVKNNNIKIGHLSLGGMLCPGLQLFVPLSPNIVLMLFDNDIYKLKNDDLKMNIRKKDVEAINQLQFINCLESIFYAVEKDEKYIKKLYKKSKNKLKHRETTVTPLSRKDNLDGTYTEIESFNKEEVHNRIKLSFLKIKQEKFTKLKKKFEELSKTSGPVVLVRNKNIEKILDEKAKLLNAHLRELKEKRVQKSDK